MVSIGFLTPKKFLLNALWYLPRFRFLHSFLFSDLQVTLELLHLNCPESFLLCCWYIAPNTISVSSEAQIVPSCALRASRDLASGQN